MKSMDTMPRVVWDIMMGVASRDNGIKVFISVCYIIKRVAEGVGAAALVGSCRGFVEQVTIGERRGLELLC